MTEGKTKIEELKTKPGRPTHIKERVTVSIVLNKDIEQLLTSYAQRHNISRSEATRAAIAEYCKK